MIGLAKEFQVLASHLNFTTAARELNISQPGLSRHMFALEQMLGFRLLERNPVKLTGAGNRFLSGISQVIREVDDLVAECREYAARDDCKLTVSFISGEDDLTRFVYNVFALLSERHPNFQYAFDEDRQTTIETSVAMGLADIGVLYHLSDDLPEGLTAEHMFDEPFCAWVHKDNPLVDKTITFADLSSCAVVLSAHRKFQTWVEGMRDACKRYGCEPQFRMKNINNGNDFLISLQRDETVFCSTSVGDFPMRINPQLRRLQIAGDEVLTYPVYLLHRERSLSRIHDEFIELFREVSALKRGVAAP